ncbi:MAG: hypothetical protein ACLFSQ_07285 [Candidatus Zixiibacteriota bacterium]
MKERFDRKGVWIIPDPKDMKKQKGDKKCLVVSRAFCHNGHSMIWKKAKVNGYPAIRIEAETKSGKVGDIVISPIYGDKTNVTLGLDSQPDEKLILRCPVCHEELQTLKKCDNCADGDIKSIFLTDDINIHDAIGICDVQNCPNAVFMISGKLLSDDMEKLGAYTFSRFDN